MRADTGIAAFAVIAIGAATAVEQTPRLGDCAPRVGERSFQLEGRLLSRSDIQADLRFLRSAIESAHGDPYRHLTREDVAGLFGAAERSASPMTSRGAFSLVACLLARFGDGHLLSLPAPAYMDSLAKVARVFPLRLFVSGKEVRIAASTNPAFPVGALVTEVNGDRMDSVVEALAQRLPGDGSSRAGPRYRAAREFGLQYYLHLGQPDSFTVGIPGRRGRVAAIPIADTLPLPCAPTSPLMLSFPSGGAALLRLPTFAADEWAAARLNYDSALSAAFGEIGRRRSTTLTIDLRGNDGGRDTYGAHLLSHLMTRPFRYYRRLTTRTDSIAFWRQTVNLDSTFNARFRAALRRRRGGGWIMDSTGHSNLRVQQPLAPTFTGRVEVLVDGGTNSTAAEFAAVAQGLGRIRVLGEETGGGREGNVSGSFAIIRLPASGVRVAIPLVRYELEVPPGPLAGRGVVPDSAYAAAPPLSCPPLRGTSSPDGTRPASGP